MSDDRVRMELKMDLKLRNKIDEYRKKQGISTRTAALLELVRKGLKQAEDEANGE